MKSKEVRLNIRTSEQTIADLKTTAKLRGLSVSSLVNMLVVKAIREEKAAVPEEFESSSGHGIAGNSIRSGQGDWREAMENAKGMWKDRDDIPDLFAELRKSWSRDVWDREEQ